MTEMQDSEARRVATLIQGKETGGKLAVVEVHERRGNELPRHLHANEDELLYVLEGVLQVCVGKKERRVATGTCLFLPRGIEHGYALETAEARLLVVLVPAGLERFFREVGMWSKPVDLQWLITVAARYGIAMIAQE